MALPYFDANPLRLVLFNFVFAIWAVPELIGSFTQRSQAGSARQDRRSGLLLIASLYLGLLVAFLLAFRLPSADISTYPSIFFSLGIILILMGVALRWYAIFFLGRFFTRDVATQSGQTILQSGPYRLIRHPSYTGSLITLVGVGLALTNWVSLLALLAIALSGYLYRISIEEHALVAVFGDSYREYMRHTRRLIPFVW